MHPTVAGMQASVLPRLFARAALFALLLGCDTVVDPASFPASTAPASPEPSPTPISGAPRVTYQVRDTMLAPAGSTVGPFAIQLPRQATPIRSLLLRTDNGPVAPQVAVPDASGRVVVDRWLPNLTGGVCDSLLVIEVDLAGRAGTGTGAVYACAAVNLTFARPAEVLAPGEIAALAPTVDLLGGKIAWPVRISWRSDRSSVVAVDSTGVVRAQGPGATKVTASVGAVHVSADVVVVDPGRLTGAPLIARVTVLPQEGYVSWVPPGQGAAGGAVWVRQLGTQTWERSALSPGMAGRTLPGRPAGTRLEVALALADSSGGVLAARLDTVTAGDGGACERLAGHAALDMRIFCTAADLKAWVGSQGLSANEVFCRGRSIAESGAELPNCVWEAADQRLLLLRGLGDSFQATPELPLPDVAAAYRRLLFGASTPEATIWQPDPAIGVPAPATRVGQVQGYASAVSWTTDVNYVGYITYFSPPAPNGAIAIYHEGHGGEVTEIGAETISWLLARGWSVVALNMPRVPHMWVRDGYRGDGSAVWRMLYGVGQVTEWIHRSWAPGRDPLVVLIGRSGGAWTSLLYAALDARIDATVTIAGLEPLTQRLSQDAVDMGDWEQSAPSLFGVLDYTDIVRLTATRPLMITYDQSDNCCFQKTEGDPFVQWLEQLGPREGARISTGLFDDGLHGLGSDGYSSLGSLLDSLLAVQR